MRDRETGLEIPDYRDKVETVVRKVFAKHAARDISPDRAALEVIESIKYPHPAGAGLEGSPVQGIDPREAEKVFRWAAGEYFKLLYIDLRRFGDFQDHERCKPSD
jgi:hypothetical protein